MRFHDLRHTVTTQMLVNGIDLLIVSRRPGHTRTSTTLDTYAHMVHGTQENAASVMDEITTLVSLPHDLIAPRDFNAPQLHRKSNAGKTCPNKLIPFSEN